MNNKIIKWMNKMINNKLPENESKESSLFEKIDRIDSET